MKLCLQTLVLLMLSLMTLPVVIVHASPTERKNKSYFGICGRTSNSSQRVVGGSEAFNGEFPWQVFVSAHNVLRCGGSLISDEWVLTAAHCVAGYGWVTVVMGTTGNPVYTSEDTRVDVSSNHIIFHKEYNPRWLTNDIAVIKLPQKVEFNDHIRPICLPSHSFAQYPMEGGYAMATGWGLTTSYYSEIPMQLMKVDLQMITNEVCRMYFGFVKEGMLCTNGYGSVGICSGDSGGPLTYDPYGQPIQVGIASFGYLNRCEGGLPSGWTRVAKYLDWIQKNTGIKIEP